MAMKVGMYVQGNSYTINIIGLSTTNSLRQLINKKAIFTYNYLMLAVVAMKVGMYHTYQPTKINLLATIIYFA